MSFYKWLLKFEDVDLPIGDVAKHVKDDENFPKESDDYKELNTYMLSEMPNPMYSSAQRALDYYKKETLEH